jgi:UTP--glucose-1-phosphate uridylyltransferase
MSSRGIRHAVIPAAGLGTRFLPTTKVVPKELLSICEKPLIQYAVEEAAASGIEIVTLVLSRSKGLVAEYFERNLALENVLVQRGKAEAAALLRSLSAIADIRVVYQDAPLGLADAVGRARSVVAGESFAVLLPDALMDSTVPCIRQLIDCHQKHPGCVIATRVVDSSEIGRFGIMDAVPLPDPCCGGRALRVISLIERPTAGSQASRHGIFGRYILDPEIFACIEQTRPGFAGELQLTDALSLYCQRNPVFAYCFEGTHYDAGNKVGFLQATLAYSLKDPELAPVVREQAPNFEPFLIASSRS